MQIQRIKIENFRSIQHAEFSVSDLNIFVGQNNCGKTNFFEAIEFFYSGVGKNVDITDLKHNRDGALELIVEIEFSGALHGAAQMQNQANKTKIETALNGSDIVVFQRSSRDPKKRGMFVGGVEVSHGAGFDAALNDFLPKFEYINTKQYYDSVAKYSKTTPIGIMLSGVLARILESNPQYQEFQEKFRVLFEADNSEIRAQFEAIGSKVKFYLEKQFPDTTKVRFEVTAPAFEDLLKNFETTVNDGVETLAEEKGDGMQRALMLAIIQAYAAFRREREDVGKSFLFFIDEAELHLHPTAQRNLKDVLHELSKTDDQVFINTHSSVFIADSYDGETIFKVEKVEGATAIEAATTFEKPFIVFELLGGSPSDLLLPRNFLIIEGQTEFEFFSNVMMRFYPDRPSIQLIKANGDVDQAERTINAIEKVYSPLRISIYRDKLIILTDQPSIQRKAGVAQFLAENNHLTVNNQFFQLPSRDIEQYYPNQPCETHTNWKKTQAELDNVSDGGNKTFTSEKKKKLAKFVAQNITQEQFETEMTICFHALEACWARAFQ